MTQSKPREWFSDHEDIKGKKLGVRGRLNILKQIRNPDCHKCQLHLSSENVCIMGRGRPTANIVLVGEAPGETEAETGKPFMGKSGRWLHDRLVELGLERDVYITNPVKCRPPENRKPNYSEIVTCGSHYFSRELITVSHGRNIIVVPMGRIAAESLGFYANEYPRHQAFFTNHPFFNGYVNPTWHPAYCLRMGRGTVQRQFIETLEWARDMAQPPWKQSK